jgi:hypothetical protein
MPGLSSLRRRRRAGRSAAQAAILRGPRENAWPSKDGAAVCWKAGASRHGPWPHIRDVSLRRSRDPCRASQAELGLPEFGRSVAEIGYGRFRLGRRRRAGAAQRCKRPSFETPPAAARQDAFEGRASARMDGRRHRRPHCNFSAMRSFTVAANRTRAFGAPLRHCCPRLPAAEAVGAWAGMMNAIAENPPGEPIADDGRRVQRGRAGDAIARRQRRRRGDAAVDGSRRCPRGPRRASRDRA